MNGDTANPPHLDLAEIEALLAFQMESGVDWVMDEQPHDRFAEANDPAPRFSIGALQRPENLSQAPQSSLQRASGAGAPALADQGQRRAPPDHSATESSAKPSARAATPAPDFASAAGDLAEQAGALARAAMSLDALRLAIEGFDGCSLKRTARQLVFADGAPDARIMFVGEAPGAEEDRTGKPFVGRSGQLLDRMLAAIGLDRSNVYIANTVPWRPPGNRTPTPQESAICRPFITRQIALVNPDVLVCLGGPSAQALLGVREGILRVRGRWGAYSADGLDIKAMATLHPAYLLRAPLQKRLAWRDLRAIRAALNESVALDESVTPGET